MYRIVSFLFGIIILANFSACKQDQNTTNSTTSTTTNSQLSAEEQVVADSIKASKPGENAVIIYAPGNQFYGSWEEVGDQYRIFCGGNKLEAIASSEGYRGIMLNDFSQIYTLIEKENKKGFKMLETTSDRLLWDVSFEETRITFTHDKLPELAYIDLSNAEQPKAVYGNQAYGTLSYSNNQHLVSGPQGSIVVSDQPYSKAYTIFGLGIAIAPPHQIILLKELLERGI